MIDVPSTSETGQAKTPSPSATRLEKAIAVLLVGFGLAGLAFLGEELAFGDWAAPASDSFAWIGNAILLLAFGLQHSGMARDSWKRLIPQRWQRVIYVAASGLVSTWLAAGWQPLPGVVWWSTAGAAMVALIAVHVLALAGMTLCILRMDLMAFLGLRPFWPSGREEVLDTSGPYRFVRHPLMSFFLVFLWARPEVTATYGWLAMGLTAYVLVGVFLEECGLRRQFGEAYDTYRRRTPMLVPFLALSRIERLLSHRINMYSLRFTSDHSTPT